MYNYRRRSLVGRLLGAMEIFSYSLIVVSMFVFVGSGLTFLNNFFEDDFVIYFALSIFGFLSLFGSFLFSALVQKIILNRARRIDPSLFSDNDDGKIMRSESLLDYVERIGERYSKNIGKILSVGKS